ncbi:MAG: hypothetical protein ACOZAN_02360 [Patescibacteria group bacterium]
MKNNLLKIIIALVLTIFVCKPYYHSGFPYTHDGENHLARFANYKIALKELQIPPRFAPNLMNRYGYPVFNYNYPLANILSLPFSFLKIHYILTFKILVFLSVFLGLFYLRKWLELFQFNSSSIIFAQVIFALNPFLHNLINYRGNIGEIMALNIVVICFYYLEKLLHDRTSFTQQNKLFLTLSLTALLLAHNISVIFAGLIFIARILTSNFKQFTTVSKNLIMPAITSLLLSLWFWLPALFEKSEVVLDNSNFFNDYLKHFPTLSQLLFAPFSFGYSRIGEVDDMSFNIGTTVTAILIVCCLLFAKLIINKRIAKINDHSIIFYFICLLLLIILQLEQSSFIWRTLPLLPYLQFPWRLSLFIPSVAAPLTALVFSLAQKNLKLLLIVMILIQTIQIAMIKPADYLFKTITDYDAYPQSTSSLNENLPKTFGYLFIGDWQPSATILEGQGKVLVEKWNGSSRKYNLELDSRSTIVEPTMNFLGWETRVTNSDGKTQIAKYTDGEIIKGRIAYQLAAGNYQIETNFRQNTPARVVGNGLFFVGLILLLINFKKIFINEK